MHKIISVSRNDKLDIKRSAEILFSKGMLIQFENNAISKHKILNFFATLFLKKYSRRLVLEKILNSNLNDNDIVLMSAGDMKAIFDYYFASNQELNKNVNSYLVGGLQARFKVNFSLFIILLKISISLIKVKYDSHPIIICTNCDNVLFLKIFRKVFPNAILVNHYCDDFRTMKYGFNLDRLIYAAKELNIHLQYYNEIDTFHDDIKFIPNAVSINKINTILKRLNSIETYFFAGRASNERGRILLKVAKLLIKLNKKIDFHVITQETSLLEEIIKINSSCGYEAIKSSGFMKYETFVEKTLSSPIVFDFYRVFPDEGYSYRIAEALVAGKSIVTNRAKIRNEAFYSEDNIFILDEQSTDIELQQFLESRPNTVKYDNIEEYKLETWLDYYDSLKG